MSRGGFVYPGFGVKHASFKRQESIPQIRFPPAFLLAARGTRQSGMFVYKCGPGKCMTHVNSHMHGSHTVWPESFSELAARTYKARFSWLGCLLYTCYMYNYPTHIYMDNRCISLQVYLSMNACVSHLTLSHLIL